MLKRMYEDGCPGKVGEEGTYRQLWTVTHRTDQV